VLLYRYTDQEDILVGTPISEQGHLNFKGIVGYFVNQILLRADLSENLTFREFLRKMHQTVQAAFEHQDYPSHLLAKQLHLSRDASYPSLFRAIFMLQEPHQRRDISPFLLGQRGGQIELGGLEMESMDLEEQMMIFVDLQLMIIEAHGSFSALWQYNTDLFDAATIERMARHFQTLLEGIVANPEQRISDIPILTEAERHQILVEWNDTKSDYPKDRCIHEVFEDQVERTPDAVAVIFEKTQMTYRELNVRANQLAHYLRALEVGPDVVVGICVERSLEMVVGLLGILKAGGAYLPLDLAYPQDRLSFMMENSRVPVLLTQEKLMTRFSEHGARVVCLDTEWSVISQENEGNLVSDVTTDNLAYVIYTSGSTGRPKGVAMRHLPLLNLIVWHLQNEAFSNRARTLQFAPVSFDVSFQEIFSTWCSGGTLVLISEKLRRDTAALLHFLRENSIERLFLPFFALQQLCEAADASELFPTSLCEVVTAGEQLQITSPVVRFFSTLKSCTLHNHYGPTESHVVTAFTLPDSVESWPALPPIGWPIANTQIYILDRSLQPVPIGVPGELHIGGDCLARGYLNRPDLTEEKFIPNPFSDEPEACPELVEGACPEPSRRASLYKTGDLARYLPDGTIEFLGRFDTQVKIRGFRIEPGEIETLLSSHLIVREAVVVAQEDGRGHKRLVAYIVPEFIPGRVPYQGDCLVELDQNRVKLRTEDISFDGVSLVGIPAAFGEGKHVRLRLLLTGGSEDCWLQGKITWRQGNRAGIQFKLSPAEQDPVYQNIEYLFERRGFLAPLRRTASANLRNYLKQRLPDYMVPSSLVFLDTLPLTPSGKVDRRALPAPGRIRPELEADFVAPRSSVEKVLADIWSDLLELEPIGVYDDFFELGGDSLMVTRAASRLRGTFQVELPISRLFEAPTIADLAVVIEKSPIKVEIQTIPRRSETGSAPLSFAQQRLWFLEQLEGGTPTYNIPFGARLRGPLDAAVLERSINEIVQRHEALRTSFATVNGRPLKVITPKLIVSLLVKDLRKLPKSEREAEVRRLALEDAQQLFDLSRCPLFRITLLRLDEEEHIMLMTTHHIIYDGWSLELFMEELTKLYEAFSTGKPSPLPDLPIQYGDFAQWQREWLQGDVLEQQLSYWKQQLSSSLPVLELPADRPRSVKRTFRGETQSFVLSRKLSDAIRTLSRQERSTLFMALLAAFKMLLYRYTGQEDIIVGSPIANRNRTELEKLIGFFVNTMVLHTDMSGNPTFRELLGRVREMTLGAQAHQDMPFDLLVKELHPERELSRQPLFQVMFDFDKPPMQLIEFPGVTSEVMEIHTETAMFDLTLAMRDMESELTGVFEYNTDLFNATTITRMIGHFQTLLKGIVADPERCLSELPILTETERHQILVEWNDTEADYSKNTCIHELFEVQVERTPDAVAVVFEGKQMTYRELNRQANQLAHYLRKLGVGPEVLVAICMERSLEMLVGLLGILKSGAAYVPMDPANPTKRLAFMLEDTCASVLVTQQQLLKKFSDHKAHTVCLDTDWDQIAGESDENPCRGVTAENLAYVIYTSGSTGIPKGVLISHQALVNRCTTTVESYNLESHDRVLQFASICFDVALEEIFPSLLSGATIVLRPEQVSMSFEALSTLLEKEKLTILNLPTAYWHEWVSELSRSNIQLPSTLRLVVVGTEQASVERLATWQTLVNDHVRWINAYGPTEATITATMYEPQMYREHQEVNSVPIGRPINNTRVYLLDPHLQPVPVGVPGELCIGGTSLARGYLNRPELTAGKFIANPFSDEPGARLYKTGDLARYLPDGNIEFLGRLDYQVKIRGFRIELGEIGSRLKQHDLIHDAVVIAHTSDNDSTYLAGYVVLNKNHLIINGIPYRVYTTAQKPSLQEKIEYIHIGSWPTFFLGDEVNVKYWKKLYDVFPNYQVAITDEAEQVVAAIHAIPLYWGEPSNLPIGWDDAVLKGFEDEKKNRVPNTLCILAGAVNREFKGKGVSYELIKIMKAIAKNDDIFEHAIVPVRPTGKQQFPEMTIEEYCQKTRDDGLSVDPWLRVHERLRGEILEYCHKSQRITGSIEQWEVWTGRTFQDSGEYIVEGAMLPVVIDIEKNQGLYYDLAVWIEHKPEAYQDLQFHALNKKALQAYLSEFLPDYMIPLNFIFLDEIPLTTSGKINKKALPAPFRSGSTKTFTAPRTSTEELLAVIWAEVLELEQLSINDNFFDLGGHSLLATLLVSKISTAMNRDFSVKLLFLHPTIAKMAVAVEKLSRKGEPSKPAPLKSRPDVDQVISFEEDLSQQLPPLFRFESYPLRSAAPFYAIALDYFPSSLLGQEGLSRDMLIHDWCNNLPTLYNVTETNWGSVGILMLPLFDSDLYSNKEQLISKIVEALEISERLGVRTVSLPGLLPSATNYGRDIAKAIAGREDLPMISTGHATTCAAVVLTIKKILQESERDLSQERVGFIGLGSIGVNTLRLMLRCLPHPMDLILCDAYNKLDFLEKIRQELINTLGFRGRVRIILSQTEVPPEIYDATLIIGATNVPDILDVTKLNAGTMIVDDSGPHCFMPELAIRRFQEQKDILFTEGGVLRSPHPIIDRVYWPPNIKKVVNPVQIMKLFSLKGSPFDITSCVFSGLLSSCFEGLHPTVGEVDVNTSLQHYEVLEQLGFRGADLHCEDYILPEELIRDFRYHFGKSRDSQWPIYAPKMNATLKVTSIPSP